MSSSNTKVYSRKSNPLGKTWEQWAAEWCSWLLSMPKVNHPNLDATGRLCNLNQNSSDVWFLAGTFGNDVPVRRTCRIPKERSILYAIIEKEDSFAEDKDLSRESELADRARKFIDNISSIFTKIDGELVENIEEYRVQSDFFDLEFPNDPVYNDVVPGLTRAVCNGYWMLVKPLSKGPHEISFGGEIQLIDNDLSVEQIKREPIYNHLKGHMDKNHSFKLDVTYELEII